MTENQPYYQPQLPFAGPAGDPLAAPAPAAPPAAADPPAAGGAPSAGTGDTSPGVSPVTPAPADPAVILPGVGDLAVYEVPDVSGDPARTRHQLVLVTGHDFVQQIVDEAAQIQKAVMSHVRGIPLGYVEDAAAFGLQALTRLL